MKNKLMTFGGAMLLVCATNAIAMPLITANGYYYQDAEPSSFTALTLRSENNGATWRYDDIQQLLPSNANIHSILDRPTDCNAQSCVMIGSYLTNSKMTPFMIVTNPFNHTWKLIDDMRLVPYGTRSSGLSQLSCSGTTCIAVGYYRSFLRKTYPLIYGTINHGQSWWSVTKVKNYQTKFPFNEVALSCADTFCVEAGLYRDRISKTVAFLPAFLVSSNNNRTWELNNNVDALPLDFTGVEAINGIQCMNSSCIVYGAYKTTAKNLAPFMMSSQDRGQHWAFVDAEAIKANLAAIQFAACTSAECIIVGVGKTAGTLSTVVSTNGGKSWTLRGTSDVLHGNYRLSTMRCHDRTCFIVGSVYGTQLDSMMIKSDDTGATWHLITNANSNHEAGYLRDVLIDGATVIAVGNQSVAGVKYGKPYILRSDNNGESWTMINDMDLPSSAKANGAFLNSVNRN